MSSIVKAANLPSSLDDLTVIAADVVGGEQVQWVKLDLGAPGASSKVSVAVPVKEQGAANIAYGQITVTNAATQIIAARALRRTVIITALGTVDVFLGDNAVTAATGSLLLGTKGSAIVIPTNVAVYGITAASTQAVSFMEVYD